MKPSTETMQEYLTSLASDEVLARAERFFATRNPLYATFPDMRGSDWATFRGQGGEEIVIAAFPESGGTRVRGSSYLFPMQVMRFFTTLPEMVRPVEVA
ncbi:MAG TPA: hypothetical protein VIJ16_01045 [Gemmatimonadaceae bacterium]